MTGDLSVKPMTMAEKDCFEANLAAAELLQLNPYDAGNCVLVNDSVDEPSDLGLRRFDIFSESLDYVTVLKRLFNGYELGIAKEGDVYHWAVLIQADGEAVSGEATSFRQALGALCIAIRSGVSDAKD